MGGIEARARLAEAVRPSATSRLRPVRVASFALAAMPRQIRLVLILGVVLRRRTRAPAGT